MMSRFTDLRSLSAKMSLSALLATAAIGGVGAMAHADDWNHQQQYQQYNGQQYNGQQNNAQYQQQQQVNILEQAKQNAHNTVNAMYYLPSWRKTDYNNRINNAQSADEAYNLANQAVKEDGTWTWLPFRI